MLCWDDVFLYGRNNEKKLCDNHHENLVKLMVSRMVELSSIFFYFSATFDLVDSGDIVFQRIVSSLGFCSHSGFF